eukprot:1902508-Prymnesium_polylepis.1
MDSCRATVRGRAQIRSPGRGVAAPLRARCPRPPSPKGPYPVVYKLTLTARSDRSHATATRTSLSTQ